MRSTDRTDAPGRVWHLTARINWQEWHLDDPEAFETFLGHLRAAAEKFSMEVLSYVVMSNHYHSITRSPPPRRFRELTGRRTRCRHLRSYPKGSPKSNVVGQFVRYLHLATARSLQTRLGVKGHLWEERHDRRRIQDPWDLVYTMAYDHLNMCEAGMVARPEDSERCSAAWWSGEGGSRIRLLSSGHLPFGLEVEEFRAWLRAHQDSKMLKIIQRELDASRHARSSDDCRLLLRKLLKRHGLDRPIAASESAIDCRKPSL